jgi:putative transcriptional regulator
MDWGNVVWNVGRGVSDHTVARMKNRLKVLRAERDWSQQHLADALGVSRQSVNAIETGKYDPSLPLAFRIADVFDERIEDIFVRD